MKLTADSFAGTQPFGQHLNLLVRPPTLIPRPETEKWACRLAKYINQQKQSKLRILDIGSGSGCIPLLLAAEVDAKRTQLDIISVDKSTAALELAKENQQLHEKSLHHCVDFVEGDMFDDDAMQHLGKFDMVVSNPPYISSQEYHELDNSVRDWEDIRALVPTSTAKADGLECYRRIADLLPELILSSSTWPLPLVLEVGWRQADGVIELLEDSNIVKRAESWKDMHNIHRVVAAFRL